MKVFRIPIRPITEVKATNKEIEQKVDIRENPKVTLFMCSEAESKFKGNPLSV